MTPENYQLHNQFITKGDLVELKQNLINEFRQILGSNSNSQSKEWLRSCEVRKMLKISTGTLQTLRINGTLNYSKIGNLYYYKYEDIVTILNTQSK